jgi:hypothetical protein
MTEENGCDLCHSACSERILGVTLTSPFPFTVSCFLAVINGLGIGCKKHTMRVLWRLCVTTSWGKSISHIPQNDAHKTYTNPQYFINKFFSPRAHLAAFCLLGWAPSLLLTKHILSKQHTHARQRGKKRRDLWSGKVQEMGWTPADVLLSNNLRPLLTLAWKISHLVPSRCRRKSRKVRCAH